MQKIARGKKCSEKIAPRKKEQQLFFSTSELYNVSKKPLFLCLSLKRELIFSKIDQSIEHRQPLEINDRS